MHEVNALELRIPIALRADRAGLVDELLAPWRDAGASDPDAECAPEVRLDLLTAENFDERASALSSFATFAALEQLRGRELLLHAAGIADPGGRVAAFVGPSGRGKTTAARRLGRHYAYVSDETVAVDASGAVRSYRKPLSVIVDGAPHKRQIAPSDLGLLALPGLPLRLAALVLLDRDSSDDAADASVSSVPLCEAVAELVPQISYLADLPDPLQFIARLVDRVGGVKRVRYREAEHLPAVVPAVFRRGVATDWTRVLPGASAGAGAYRAAPTLDAIEADGQAAVFLAGGTLHLLDGIGPGLWRALCAGAQFEGMVHAVRDEFGDPPDGTIESAVENALQAFLAHGLAVRGAA